MGHLFIADLEHITDPELAHPGSLTGSGYWGEEYMDLLHGTDEAKNFGWDLGRAFQILPTISSSSDLNRLLGRIVSSQSSELREFMKPSAIPIKKSSEIQLCAWNLTSLLFPQ
jgi:hypothetical protein